MSTVYSRAINRSGCPYCLNKKACKENCLKVKFPEIAKEWYYINNNGLNPEQVTYGIKKEVEWICKKGHIWKASINSRTNRKTGCPICAPEKMKGENNPNYNFNLTDKDRIDRRGLKEYREWRKKVYSRDKYVCQICGDNRGGIFNAHHLMSYDKYSELRFDINNGITLCEQCHKDFHNIYGRGNNTIEQFQEYERNLLIK